MLFFSKTNKHKKSEVDSLIEAGDERLENCIASVSSPETIVEDAIKYYRAAYFKAPLNKEIAKKIEKAEAIRIEILNILKANDGDVTDEPTRLPFKP